MKPLDPDPDSESGSETLHKNRTISQYLLDVMLAADLGIRIRSNVDHKVTQIIIKKQQVPVPGTVTG